MISSLFTTCHCFSAILNLHPQHLHSLQFVFSLQIEIEIRVPYFYWWISVWRCVIRLVRFHRFLLEVFNAVPEILRCFLLEDFNHLRLILLLQIKLLLFSLDSVNKQTPDILSKFYSAISILQAKLD